MDALQHLECLFTLEKAHRIRAIDHQSSVSIKIKYGDVKINYPSVTEESTLVSEQDVTKVVILIFEPAPPLQIL